MGNFQHKQLASGRWQTLTLAERMGNIGSEVHRALMWKGKDTERFDRAVERALELFDLTLKDARWNGRLREIARSREIFCDTVFRGGLYKSSLEELDRYFLQFALLASSHT